jgi:glycogen debranching enzyme
VIDVAAATQQALVATAEIGRILDDRTTASHYETLAGQLKQRINQRFWLDEDSSYADFYGTRAEAVSTAEGAAKQIALPGPDKLSDRDREQIRYYQKLRDRWAALPDTTKGWITNQNLTVITPMELGIAPADRAVRVLDRLREQGVGKYGPYLSAVDQQAMMSIATGIAAVAEANYGRTDQSLWYVDKLVQTFNRKLPGSISEMLPDYGCFVIAWTMYGVVLPLVQHVFGVQPDAVHKTVAFEPHLPNGWEEMSIQDLPVGSNRISFSRRKTDKGIEYTVNATESGWTYLLKGRALSGGKLYLNSRPIAGDSSGVRMSGKTNRLLVVP